MGQVLSAIMIRIDDPLNQLAEQDPREAQLIATRFFTALTADDFATVLALSVNIVRRALRAAQARLLRELNQDSDQ